MSTESETAQTPRAGENLLEAMGLPIFFDAGHAGALGLGLPENRHGQTVRVWARSLTVMQKEAIVVSARSGRAWRVTSDEGPYLDGFDFAPCPLSLLTTGMVSSYMNEILALARHERVEIRELTLIQDNRYTMEGSALQGTMTGGALPVELAVHVSTDADEASLARLLRDAVAASPLHGLLRPRHRSLFTLTLNDKEIPVGRVGAIGEPAPPDPAGLFERLTPAGGTTEPLVERVQAIDIVHGIVGGAGSSLQATQKRQLHLRGTCRLREDGVKEVTQELFSPRGSTFRFLSDETAEFDGRGRAPDSVAYAAAGIAFCFMTQLGRYAKILKRNLERYNLIQDIHFSLGGASAATGRPGVADAVETHVYLASSEDEAFARQTVDMGEQTCFLHALCRTEVNTHVTVNPPPTP